MGRTRSGFGQVAELTSGRWRARYTIPGAVPRRWVNAGITFATKRDAELWLARQRTELADGILRPRALASEVTFRAYTSRWIEERRNSRGEPLRPATRALYERYLELHVMPALGERTVATLTKDEMRAWYRGLSPDHPTNRARVYALVRAILRTAVDEDDLLPANPLVIRGAGQSPPARDKTVATAPQVDELARLMPERLALAIKLGAWCSLRIGEVLELRRRDVTPEAVTISRAVTFARGETFVGAPKTRAGSRTVHVPPHLAGEVRAHLLAHTNAGSDGLLFPLYPGEDRHMHRRTLGGHVSSAVAKSTLPRGFSFHALRHSGLTWAGRAGATVAELQNRAGHATPTIVARYQHATDERDAAIAAAMSAQTGRRHSKNNRSPHRRLKGVEQ